MLLGIKDRIWLMTILPQETNFVLLKIIRTLRQDLSFSEDEIKEFDIKPDEKGVNWNPANEKEKDINIGEMATQIIVKQLHDLDKAEKLTENHLSLWEKFIG